MVSFTSLKRLPPVEPIGVGEVGGSAEVDAGGEVGGSVEAGGGAKVGTVAKVGGGIKGGVGVGLATGALHPFNKKMTKISRMICCRDFGVFIFPPIR